MSVKRILFPIVAVFVMAACGGNKEQVAENNDQQNNAVLSAEEQSQLTPDRVIEILKQGNDDFINNRLTVRNNTERVKNAAEGQHPQAVILSCLDSRVPVEDVFNQAIGDVFVARVAGNIVNPDILGSMEFACKASGAKLVVVVGHGYCGAIKHAIDGTELGNITEMLSKVKPAVARAKEGFEGETTSANPEFVDKVCHVNVEVMIEEIRKNSPILKEMEDKGEIKIVGAMYDMHTGKVDFFAK